MSTSPTGVPEVRKGQTDVKLSEKEFGRWFDALCSGRKFDGVIQELARVRGVSDAALRPK